MIITNSLRINIISVFTICIHIAWMPFVICRKFTNLQSAGFQALSSLSLSVRVDSVMTVHMSDGDHFSGLIEDDKSAITTVHGNGGML